MRCESRKEAHTHSYKHKCRHTYKHAHSGAAAKAQLQMYSQMPIRTCQGLAVTRAWPVWHTEAREERVIR